MFLFIIDVDSYQTPGFPATAADGQRPGPPCRGFSEETDWFSFAIVSFQMFAGIHPYRGNYPALPRPETPDEANVSVLNPRCHVPKVCYPFSVIPPVTSLVPGAPGLGTATSTAGGRTRHHIQAGPGWAVRSREPGRLGGALHHRNPALPRGHPGPGATSGGTRPSLPTASLPAAGAPCLRTARIGLAPRDGCPVAAWIRWARSGLLRRHRSARDPQDDLRAEALDVYDSADLPEERRELYE